jgi:hypothetical protein
VLESADAYRNRRSPDRSMEVEKHSRLIDCRLRIEAWRESHPEIGSCTDISRPSEYKYREITDLISSVCAAVIAVEAMMIGGGTTCASSSEMVAKFTRWLYGIVERSQKN